MNLALFDLDHTLIPMDSDHAFGEFLVARGLADAPTHRAANDAFYADYLAGRLDMTAYVEFATRAWRDLDATRQGELSDAFMREIVAPRVHDSARALVQRHRDRGDRLLIVTATNEFVTAPIARAFGVDVLIATALERDASGRVTGRIQGIPNLGAGKVHNVAAWLAAQGLSWSDVRCSTCYSDSTNDLPLLEQVHHPVATNPGAELERIAQARAWPILRLFA
jgi:HAD superfamily hydrolase (TIGR01490 family)